MGDTNPLDQMTLAKIQSMFDAVPTVEEISLELSQEPVDWEMDPELVADYLKMQFVEDVYRIMEEKGIKPIDLAAKLGKTRQYVSKILNEKANFTFETMAAIACALDVQIGARLYTHAQQMAILPVMAKPRLFELSGFQREETHVHTGLGDRDAGYFAA